MLRQLEQARRPGSLSFSGDVVIVTGGARGIGLACVRRFAREGARVVIADIDEEAGRAAQKDVEGAGGAAIFAHVDVSEPLDVHNMMAATIDAYNRVDILINNAGISVSGDFLSLGEEQFDKVMRVNLKGPFLASQAAARQMLSQLEDEGAGRRQRDTGYCIINISSVSAVTSSADNSIYAASKAGLNQLTRTMSLSLAPHGIRVNAVGPGNVSSGLGEDSNGEKLRDVILSRTPLGRLGDPDEIAGIVAFLASEDAAYITGQCIYADGGRLSLNYTVSKPEP